MKLSLITAVAFLAVYMIDVHSSVVISLDDQIYVIPTKNTVLCDRPKVFWVDDIGPTVDIRTEIDPNAVQEIPILIGWDNFEHFDLVGAGVASHDAQSDISESFAQTIFTKAGSNIDVKSGVDLEKEIVEQALAFNCTDDKLNIVVGAPWNIVEDAIDRSNCVGISNCTPTPINDRIRMIGIGGSNVGKSSAGGNLSNLNLGNRRSAYDRVRLLLGNENYVEIEPSEFTEYLNPTKGYIDYEASPSWYEDTFHDTVVGDYLKDQGYDANNIRTNYCQYGTINGVDDPSLDVFCNNIISGDADFPSNASINPNQEYSFRGADFTALAYVIWGAAAFTMGADMYDRIEDGALLLPMVGN